MGPVAASKVGLVDGKFVLNPNKDEIKNSSLELVVAGTNDAVLMVESEASGLSEKQMLDAVKYGHDSFKNVIKMISELHGKASGCCGGRGGSMHLFDEEAGIMSSLPIVGSVIPLAVGNALYCGSLGWSANAM